MLDLQVLRVALLALKNLLVFSGSEAGPKMVDAGLDKAVKQRKQQVSAQGVNQQPPAYL